MTSMLFADDAIVRMQGEMNEGLNVMKGLMYKLNERIRRRKKTAVLLRRDW